MFVPGSSSLDICSFYTISDCGYITFNLREGSLGNITYENAPLVELIVELRWNVNVANVPGAPPFITDKSSVFDYWFNRFSNELEGLGYNAIERLLPHDIPPVAHQPVFRYRKKRDSPFPVVQFGHGVFSVNAGPPGYVSWEKFRPEVENSVGALINTIPSDGPSEFVFAMVRYLDAFRDTLKKGASNFSFMKNDLKVSLQLPHGVFDLAESEDEIIPTMALRFPVKGKENSQLTLQVAAGQVNKETATVMDMTHVVKDTIQKDVSQVLSVLDSSHDILHSVFEVMTSQIKDRMGPSENS